ncbi:MAG: hypothetical protein ACI828_002567 [Flavobacteriales bacterium]|jgi:hypothetical protein
MNSISKVGRSKKKYRKVVLKLLSVKCSFLVFLVWTMTISAQNQRPPEVTSSILVGNWEGNIMVDETKSVGIVWRFEQSKEGGLTGFMGPASKGRADLVMQRLSVDTSNLIFSIQAEGSFSGTITSDTIKGNWNAQERKKLAVTMTRELTQEQRLSLAQNTEGFIAPKDVYESIQRGDLEAVSAFLNKGNGIDKIDDTGYTLLVYAIKKDKTHKVATYLLDRGADPNMVVEGISPLMYAVGYQNYVICEKLIQHHADINYVSVDKQSALLFAVKGRDVKALQLLIRLGADPSVSVDNAKTAIDFAKEENVKEILEVLNVPYEGVSDGPYIIKTESGYTAKWVYKGQEHSQKLSPKASQTFAYKEMQATLWEDQPTEVTELNYTGDFRIAAVSDIHGQYKTFLELLKNNDVIDAENMWNFGNGHLVVTGDMFDRGSQVTEVLWFLYHLEKQAQEDGGKLHVLLGNHDVMVLNGNLRSVHPKYIETARILNQPFQTLFSKGSILGDWLRTRPVIVNMNNMLFTHGGLHPDVVAKGLSIDQINHTFKRQLIESELSESRSDLGNFLHKSKGPIYYRGYFQGELATAEQIQGLLQYFNVTNIIVGHTTHRQIETRYEGKVIVIDANLKSGSMGEMLFWESGKFHRGTLSGQKLPLINN